VTFHFLDDVFLLYLSLEAAKRVFEGLALLQSHFCQSNYTPHPVQNWTVLLIASLVYQVKQNVEKHNPHFQKRNLSPNCTSRGAYALFTFRKLVGF
jgi:hypothetical protein